MVRLNQIPGFVPGLRGLCIVASLSLVNAQAPQAPRSYEGTAGGPAILEEGQAAAMIHATVENANRAHSSSRAASTGNNLFYNGGTGGIGVETMPKIYLVLWGSQWNNNDPSGEATILQQFYSRDRAHPNHYLQQPRGVSHRAPSAGNI